MKNLVYFTVFYNKDYFRLADLLLKSMKTFSTVADFDILLLTAPEFREQAEDLAKILPLKIHYMHATTIFQAACARLRVFAFPEIDQYEKILYLDTDIIIKKDLAPIFQEPLNDVLYGLEHGIIGSYNFGAQFFDFATIAPNTTAINSGTLLFRNSNVIRALFDRMCAHIDSYTGDPPYCMDQPFINYHAIKDGLYNNTLLKPHVSLYEGGEITNYETSSICHFSFPIGNFHHKFGRMTAFFEKILTDKSTDAVITGLEGKTFSWGTHGKITFGLANILQTTWAAGKYLSIGDNRVRATWNSHSHILKFDGDAYTSVRVQPMDFDCVSGSSGSLTL